MSWAETDVKSLQHLQRRGRRPSLLMSNKRQERSDEGEGKDADHLTFGSNKKWAK